MFQCLTKMTEVRNSKLVSPRLVCFFEMSTHITFVLRVRGGGNFGMPDIYFRVDKKQKKNFLFLWLSLSENQYFCDQSNPLLRHRFLFRKPKIENKKKRQSIHKPNAGIAFRGLCYKTHYLRSYDRNYGEIVTVKIFLFSKLFSVAHHS